MFHSYRGKQSGLERETFAGVTSKPEGEYYLIAQEVESGEYRGESVQYLYYENAYKGRGVTYVRGSGSVHRGCNDT